MMRAAAVLLLALAFAVPVPAESRLVPYAIYGVGHGADIWSTRIGIANGGRELNPLAKTPVKLLVACAMAEGDRMLDRSGHRRRKWVVRGVFVLVYSAAVHHNLRVGAREKR
jgi:hypothetical protein